MSNEDFDREHLMSVHHQPVVELANEKRREIAEAMNSFAPKDLGEDEREKLMPQALAVIKEAQKDYIRYGQITDEIEQCFKTIFGEEAGLIVIEQVKRIADEEWQGRKDALILIGDLYEQHRLEEKNMKRKEIIERDNLSSAKFKLKGRKLKLEPEICDSLLDWFSAVESEDKNKVFDASRSLLPVLSELISSGKGFALCKRQGRPEKGVRDTYVYAYSKVYSDVEAAEKFHYNPEDPSRIRQIRRKWERVYSGKDLELFKVVVIEDIIEKELAFDCPTLTIEEIKKFALYALGIRNNLTL
ncbi:hypothetical protein [Vibrio parahaemolyticus]|uniref:hypothetical protein n=1 Tax=Vibrio parahaemolyticus TaxID=670 RepID=UPI003296C259|nr:hypothetical protein [Vibrio parahaemolyticus]